MLGQKDSWAQAVPQQLQHCLLTCQHFKLVSASKRMCTVVLMKFASQGIQFETAPSSLQLICLLNTLEPTEQT
jgi:hypothetical protein